LKADNFQQNIFVKKKDNKILLKNRELQAVQKNLSNQND